MTADEQLVADKRQLWQDFSRLLFWGAAHVAVFLIVVVMFAVYGPHVGTVAIALLLVGANFAITAGYFLSHKW